MMFEVGQMVVCVDAHGTTFLEKGRVYEVTRVDTLPEFLGIAPRAMPGQFGDGWYASRFRPVRKTDISELRKLVAPVPRQPVPAE